MTHGDKAKAKAGKGSQASGAKGGTKGSRDGEAKSKPVKAAKAGSAKAAAVKKGTGKTVKTEQAPGNGKPKTTDAGSQFSNPVVGAAFKWALKTYPNAFRKLTE